MISTFGNFTPPPLLVPASSAVVSLPLLPQWQFKVWQQQPSAVKCTLQFKPAHQSRARWAVTVASNICTTKERLADSSTPPPPSSLPTPFPFHRYSSSPAFVLGPKIPFYPCDPPPLCTNLLVPIGLSASVLPLSAPRPPHPAPQRTHITGWPRLQALLLLLLLLFFFLCLAWMRVG